MNANLNFAGIPDQYASYETSKTVIIPVSYKGNTDATDRSTNSPKALLEAAQHIELYDHETNTEVYKNGIYLLESLQFTSPSIMVDEVYNLVKKYIKRNKFIALIGQDAAVSMGAVKASNECFDDLTILQIDAHANVCAEYKGTTIHPRCAMFEANQQANLVQVGIRSITKKEKTLINSDQVFFANEMATDDYWMDTITDLLTGKVYVSFNLNAMDPSLISSVYHPEPGGLFWYETLEFLQKVCKEKEIIGLDFHGLHTDQKSDISAILASKLFYKILNYKFLPKD